MTHPIAHLHAQVWQVRAKNKHAWPTPLPLDCLRRAVVHAGQAMAASLDDTPERVLDALGDCAVMLASALEQTRVITRPFSKLNPQTIDSVAGAVFRAFCLPPAAESKTSQIERAMYAIFAYPDFTPTIALLRLELIRAKYTTDLSLSRDAKTALELARAFGDFDIHLSDDQVHVRIRALSGRFTKVAITDRIDLDIAGALASAMGK